MLHVKQMANYDSFNSLTLKALGDALQRGRTSTPKLIKLKNESNTPGHKDRIGRPSRTSKRDANSWSLQNRK